LKRKREIYDKGYSRGDGREVGRKARGSGKK